MSLREKVYQMMIVRPEALADESDSVTDASKIAENIAAQPVGGFVLSADNLVSPEQASALISGRRRRRERAFS
jgi:beta-glucosidase-like glycosyl hydrolase